MRAFLIAALALAGCAHAPDASAPPPQPASQLAQDIGAENERLDRELGADGVFAAGIGETADLGGGLIVRPLAVIEDSRCPVDVMCVWAGRLVLRANVSGVERELTLGQQLATPNGALVLTVARPAPRHNRPEGETSRPSYRFGFRRGD
ncbi:MAG: hypothetical protein ABL883_05635 [Terricaulis sp.]